MGDIIKVDFGGTPSNKRMVDADYVLRFIDYVLASEGVSEKEHNIITTVKMFIDQHGDGYFQEKTHDQH